MNANPNKVLLPNDVRKLLNADNKEIVELCKKTSVTPKRDQKGQIYFSVDEVKKLRNAKSSVVSEMNVRGGSTAGRMTLPNSQNNEKGVRILESIRPNGSNAEKKATLPAMTKPNSQNVVNGLLETLNKMENNITTSMTKLIDEKLEGMDDVVLELVRCKTENENLKNKVNELNKENFKLKNVLNSFKPLICGFYIKKEEDTNFML